MRYCRFVYISGSQLGVICLLPRRHWAVSEDSFDCHCLGEWCWLLACSGWRPGVLWNLLQCTGQPLQGSIWPQVSMCQGWEPWWTEVCILKPSVIQTGMLTKHPFADRALCLETREDSLDDKTQNPTQISSGRTGNPVTLVTKIYGWNIWVENPWYPHTNSAHTD